MNTNEQQTLDLTLVKEQGWSRGYEIASHATEELTDGMELTDAEKQFYEACFDIEENNRQFSPFEFTAHALNEAENSDEAWEAFDEGIHEGFQAYWERVVLKRFTFR